MGSHEIEAPTAADGDGVGAVALDDLTFLRACDPDYVWEPGWKGEFLRNLRAQPNVSAAARLAGVTPQAAYLQQKNDPLFAAVWHDAKKQSIDLLAGFAHRMSTTGLPQNETRTTVKRTLDPRTGQMRTVEETTVTVEGVMISPQMAQFLLRAHDPKQYIPPERRELTGADGGPVQSQHVIYRQPDEQRVRDLARAMVEQEDADRAALEAAAAEDAEFTPVAE